MFVAVGYGGRRIRSADGIQWDSDVIVDPQGGDDDNLFRGVAFIDGQFLAVGGSAKGQIATSPNGADWTFRTPGTSWLADVAPIGTTLVTAGGNGLRQRSLDGGVTWVDAAPYYAGHYRGITSGKGTAVAAGHTYGNSMVGLTTTSIDGKTCVVSGSGNVAIYAIEKVHKLGGIVIGCSDSSGYIVDEKGIDLDVLKELKEVRRGRISDYVEMRAGASRFVDTAADGGSIWQLPCDIALPCATQNELNADDALSFAELIGRRAAGERERQSGQDLPDLIVQFARNRPPLLRQRRYPRRDALLWRLYRRPEHS